MRRNELTIFEDTLSSQGRFRPLKFWVSEALADHGLAIRQVIGSIQRGLTHTKTFGGTHTLHIGTAEELRSADPNVYFVTFEAIVEMSNRQMNHFVVGLGSRKCVSLCFFECSFVLGSVKRQDVGAMTLLCGGEIVKMDNCTHFVTDSPIVTHSVPETAEIVSSEWVLKCFEARKRLPVERPKPFEGLTFTSTDLEPCESRALKKLVIANGGAWHDSFDDSITCLIAERLAMTPKVRIALSESVPIVKPGWIHAQIERFVSPERFLLNFWCWKKTKSALFQNLSFAIHIECEDRDLVIKAVKANSGRFSNNPNLLIVPHFYNVKSELRAVTATWIWHVISEGRLVPYDMAIVFSIFPFEKASPKLKGFVVVLCGIRDPERYTMAEGLRCLGVTVHFRVSEFTNVIVAESKDEDLARAAQKFGVAVVRTSWVNALLTTGRIPDTRGYVLDQVKSRTIDVLCDAIQRTAEGKHSRNRSRTELPKSQGWASFSDDECDIQTSPHITVAYDTTEFDPNSSQNRDTDPLMNLLGA